MHSTMATCDSILQLKSGDSREKERKSRKKSKIFFFSSYSAPYGTCSRFGWQVSIFATCNIQVLTSKVRWSKKGGMHKRESLFFHPSYNFACSQRGRCFYLLSVDGSDVPSTRSHCVIRARTWRHMETKWFEIQLQYTHTHTHTHTHIEREAILDSLSMWYTQLATAC